MLENSLEKVLVWLLKKKNQSHSFLDQIQSISSAPAYLKPNTFIAPYKKWLAEGLTNGLMIPYFPDHPWPFWVNRQSSPEYPGYCSSGVSFFMVNTTHRNWTRLSDTGTTEASMVDPTGMITPFKGGWSIELWLANDQQLISPAKLSNVTQTCVGGSPVIQTCFQVKDLAVASEAFFQQDGSKNNLLFQRVSIQNRSKDTIKVSFYFAIRPYNPEGISPIEHISYLSANAFVINNQLGVVLDQKPDNVVCVDLKDTQVSKYYRQWDMILNVKSKVKMASAFAEYRLELAPNEERVLSAKYPTTPNLLIKPWYQSVLSNPSKAKLQKEIKQIQLTNYSLSQASYIEKEKKNKDTVLRVSLPNQSMSDAVTLNVMYLSRFYWELAQTNKRQDVLLLPDYLSLLQALWMSGYQDLALKGVQNCLKLSPVFIRYRAQDPLNVLSQFIMTFYFFYKESKDKLFLQSAMPYIVQFMKILKSKYGLKESKLVTLSAAFKWENPDEVEFAKEHYVKNGFWALKGLKVSQIITEMLNESKLTQEFELCFQKLKRQIESYLSVLQAYYKKCNYFPVSSNRLLDSQLIETLDAVCPLDLISGDSESINNTLRVIEDRFVSKGLFFNHLKPQGYAIQQNLRLALIYIEREDARAFTIINQLLGYISPTGCWPDAIHPTSLGGQSGDGHSLSASVEFVQLIKRLLINIDTKNRCIYLLPFVPKEWLQPGQKVKVDNLYTEFGKIGFSIEMGENKALLTFTNDYQHRPTSMKITMPKLIKEVSIDGVKKAQGHESITIPALAKYVELYF